ncbi:hypothetical protein ACVOMV_27325 (plasmid) [Mesorhizobium atlanticum]|uniref:hypothetical protein n=1 Tax=Mesorhizobium atlanticum TaxID=2233532 RepID=UPI00370492FA
MLERAALFSPDIAISEFRAGMIEHGLRRAHVAAGCSIVLDGDAAPEHPRVEARQRRSQLVGMFGIPCIDTPVRPLDESSHGAFEGRALDDADVPARPAHQEQPILFTRRCARHQ